MSEAVALGVLTGRSLRLARREIDALITSFTLPVMIMLVFVYLFGGAIEGSLSGDYIDYVVPGVLLLCVAIGAAQTAVTVASDLAEGYVDRLRAMDLGGATLLGAHVGASTVRNLLSSLVLLGVGVLVGFRPDASASRWLLAGVVMAAAIVALSWIAAVLGLLAGSVEAANGFSFLLMFLVYPSSAFVPVATMPGWLQGFAEHQPVTVVVESLRGLLLGGDYATDTVLAITWCAGISAAAALLAGALFTRKTR
jgi:ABC-2 type transport system permease protein